MTATVLIRWLADGSFQFAATEGVQVVCVDDRIPADRVYVTDPQTGALTASMLREVIGDSEIGYSGVGFRAVASAEAILEALAEALPSKAKH